MHTKYKATEYFRVRHEGHVVFISGVTDVTVNQDVKGHQTSVNSDGHFSLFYRQYSCSCSLICHLFFFIINCLVYKMSAINEKCPSLFSSCLSKTQRHSIDDDIKDTKAADSHIVRSWNRNSTCSA